MITTVIFDLSEVLLSGAAGSEKLLEKRLSRKITDSELLISEIDRLFTGEISEDIYWQLVIEHNSWDITISELKKAIRQNFREIKGTRKIIEGLKQKGYKLGLLSNHAKEWIIYCETNYKYQGLFHEVVYSYQAGFSKPHPNIFLFILKKLKVKPEECLFIDDHIKNIESARRLGFNTIHFISPEDLKRKLKELKI